MGAARTSIVVLVLLGYGVVAGGVVLANRPLEALLAEPPLVELGVPTVVALVAVVLVGRFAP